MKNVRGAITKNGQQLALTEKKLLGCENMYRGGVIWVL